ncbi:MAG TPA: phosphate ABC transporter substrate-binding protein [Pseudomonadales bacterium]|nr:phosphate ABC transporter substrate-binding protein [Pseudomonadales bacterium]
MKKSHLSKTIGVLLLFAVSSFTYAELVVVVNPQNTVQSLSKEDVSRIYLGKNKNFPNGSDIETIDLHKDSQLREDFYRKVCGKSPSQIASYWSRLIFTGKGVPPRSVDTEAAAKEWIVSHPNSMAYIDSANVDGSVKVVLRVK